jgi:hypothetical protein
MATKTTKTREPEVISAESYMTHADDYLTATATRERLGVSRSKMTSMLSKGMLHPIRTDLDARVRLFRVAEVEVLASQLQRMREMRAHLYPAKATR